MHVSENVGQSRSICQLFRFMLLFGINRFQIFGVLGKTIKARVGWEQDPNDIDDEIQDIEWDIQGLKYMEEALEIAEFLIDQGFVNSDKIIIDESALRSKMLWKKEKFDAALSTLLSLRVDMVDEGKRTDYFFLHF